MIQSAHDGWSPESPASTAPPAALQLRCIVRARAEDSIVRRRVLRSPDLHSPRTRHRREPGPRGIRPRRACRIGADDRPGSRPATALAEVGRAWNRRMTPLRNSDATLLLESFLVAAVISVLVIRWVLTLTGFPRLGGGGLHIAHMLWGGGLMLVAILLLLAYLDRSVQHVAAVIAGLGLRHVHRRGRQVHHRRQRLLLPTGRGLDLRRLRHRVPGRARARRSAAADADARHWPMPWTCWSRGSVGRSKVTIADDHGSPGPGRRRLGPGRGHR